jgi:hypothetical protein
MKFGKFRTLEDGKLAFYCKGCECYHWVRIDKNENPHWEFNGNYDKPTFNPSILVTIGHYPQPNGICHSFITDGKIQYLSDCTHQYAGQTIELEDEED